MSKIESLRQSLLDMGVLENTIKSLNTLSIHLGEDKAIETFKEIVTSLWENEPENNDWLVILNTINNTLNTLS